MSAYNTALEYTQKGLLSHKRDSQGHSLFCYTKECFFGDDTWDEITESHRGQMYYKKKPVNKPFNKIFNVDEMPQTQHDVICERMKTDPYEIYDKANGHLFIVSFFVDENGEQHGVFSTKGSLLNEENELLNRDVEIFVCRYALSFDKVVEKFPTATFMFEAIVQHDKHTMYDQQVEQYGDEDIFVLLGVNIFEETYGVWCDMDHEDMARIAHVIGCPVVKKYDEVEGTPLMWKDHKNIEGYVIRFMNDNFRVKIKTTEYWQNRFKKDLTPERIIDLFEKGGYEKLRSKLPEEVCNQLIDYFYHEMLKWFYDQIDWNKVNPFLADNTSQIDDDLVCLNGDIRKWLFTESNFNEYELKWIINVVDDKDLQLGNNKKYRERFCFELLKSEIVESDLKEIVYNAL